MLVFFGIVGVLGFVMIVLDFAAASNSVAPSQYSYGIAQTGGLFMIVGAVGAGCVAAFG